MSFTTDTVEVVVSSHCVVSQHESPFRRIERNVVMIQQNDLFFVHIYF